jgi:hypothetical protein
MFKKGQKIVAIKDHSQGMFHKGDVFTVLGVSHSPCCKLEVVDIGLMTPNGWLACRGCNHTRESEIAWIKARCFVPIQEEFQPIELTKILELETPFIGVN